MQIKFVLLEIIVSQIELESVILAAKVNTTFRSWPNQNISMYIVS